MYAAQQPTIEPATIPHKATKRAFRPAKACQISSHTLIAAIASSLLHVSAGLQCKALSALAEGQRSCTQASPATYYILCTVSTCVERPPQGLERPCACWTCADQRAARQEATYSATQIRAGSLSLHRMGWASGAEQIVPAGHPADSWRAIVRDIHAKGCAVTLAAVEGPLRAVGGANALEGDWHGVDVKVAVARVMQAPSVQHHVLDKLIHLWAALACQEVRTFQHDARRLQPACRAGMLRTGPQSAHAHSWHIFISRSEQCA